MSEFLMPSLGADMEAGTLVAWLVAPGAHVNRGDIIAEVETDKGVIEVEVFVSAVVERLLVAEGTKVPVGTPLALLRDDAPEQPSPSSRRQVSPAARRLAKELGVDPDKLLGSGPEGAVTRQDVLAAGSSTSHPKPDAERVRQAIASAMALSNREIPHYYVGHTIDLAAANEWITARNASLAAEERMVLGALLLKAVGLAVRDYPELNARFEGGEVRAFEAVNVGVAISLRGGGLVIAAIDDTDRQPVDAVMASLRDLVARARRGQLKSSELGGATLTVTSLGDRGVQWVAGVIYPPQTALVGFGTPALRPWVVDGSVVPRLLVDVTLAADHRASDGHRGALFLAAVDRLLQKPEEL